MIHNINIKRISAAFVTLAVLVSSVICPWVVSAQDEISEKIEIKISFLGKNTYSQYAQKFTKVDLRPYMNRSFIDEVEGDGGGGWSDQGSNDFRTFTDRGAKEYLGIPFDIVEPDDNNGKSVIVLPGQGHAPKDCSTNVDIDLKNTTAGGFYILHTSAYAGDYVSGTYTINYTDGTKAYIDLLNSVHIYNSWGKNENPLCRLVWTGSSAATKNGISLGLFALNNPHPEKAIKSFSASTTGYGPYMMIIGMTLTDSLPALPTFSEDDIRYNPTTFIGWNKYEAGDTKKISGSILDMSKYLDAPAGKHGRLKVQGEKFVFEDGTSIKFWGTNLLGDSCFPEKEIADELSQSIAQCGYNVVRFSEFDGENGILCEDGVTVNQEKLGKMAYLISQLEKRGVYTYLTFTSLRETTENIKAKDNQDVADGFKLKGFIDEGLIGAQKDFVKQILTYQSPYTGKRLGDSNSLVMVEFMDSNTMFEYTSGYSEFSTHSNEYRSEIKNLFNEYLIKKYKTTSNLKKVWKGTYDLQPHENLENSSVELKSVWRDFLYSDERITDIQMFFAELQLKYYEEMKNTLTDIGVNVLSTCNSNAIGNIDTADSYMNSQTDFISRKSFWPEPSAKNSKKLTDDMVMPHYNSVISETYGGIFGELAKNRVLGTPYVVSGWSVLETNSFLSEMPLIMATLSARQGWNSISYAFVTDNFNFDGDYKIEDFYSAYRHPIRMAMMPVSAMLFYTTDESKKEKSTVYTENEINSFDELDEYEKETLIAKSLDAKFYANKDMYFYNPFTRFSNYELLGGKFGIKISEKSQKKTVYSNNNHQKITQDGMVWNIAEQTFEITTDYVQAATGILAKPIDMNNLYFELGTYSDAQNWGTTVSLASVDNKKIKESERMLLTTVSRAFNSNFQTARVRYDSVIKSPKTSGIVYNTGDAPVMVEAVHGRFVLKLKGNYDVYALSSSGERGSLIRTEKTSEGYLSFTISQSGASQHYEIVKR